MDSKIISRIRGHVTVNLETVVPVGIKEEADKAAGVGRGAGLETALIRETPETVSVVETFTIVKAVVKRKLKDLIDLVVPKTKSL